MSIATPVNQKDGIERDIFYLFIPTFYDFPVDLELSSKKFAMLFLCDVNSVKNRDLLLWAHTLIEKGLVYSCSWGTDSSRVENAVDFACVEKEIDEKGEASAEYYFAVTTAHEDESIDEFLWYGLNLSYPDEKDAEECRSNLVVVVKNEEWNKYVRSVLSDVEAFNKMILEEEETDH